MTTSALRHPFSLLGLLLALALTGCPPGDTIDDDDDDSAVGDDDDDSALDTTPDGNTYAVLVQGDLFSQDPVAAQEAHDAIAAGGEEAARALGDVAHDVLLNVETGAFLGLDRWDNPVGLEALYADPEFGAAFATLFAGPPSVEVFVREPAWSSWGDYESGDASGVYFWVVVRGRLVESDPVLAQQAHDAVAEGGREAAIAAGDLAHIVHTGLEDPQEFFAIDIWDDAEALGGFYSNPDIAAAFGSLFEEPPTITVNISTEWYQW